MGIRVGIDLGTTFSAVAWVNPRTRQPEIIQSDDSNQMITPSEIWFSLDGKVYYGARAKEAFETGEEGVANTFKRYMGTDDVCFLAPDGREYRAEKLSAMLLKYLKEQAEKHSGQTIDEAVITVPAYFEDEPRKATRRAAQAAGLRVQDIISEPTAAALNYGLDHWRQNALIMVYDLGGGTFDVTLVGMTDNTTLTTLGTTGDHRKGGRDWDEELARLVLGKVEDELGISLSDEFEVINDIRAQAEEWKKQLSQIEVIRPRIRVPGSGYAQISVSRAEFDEATAALLNQTASLCESLLNDLHVTWSQITDVLLVGGSTRMPQVSQFLTNLRNGREPIRHVNPDYAVALGAAMRANMTQKTEVVNLTGGVNAVEAVATRNAGLLQSLNRNVRDQGAVELSAIRFQDAVAHAMGIVLVNEAQTAYINETIIPANAPVPCKFSRPTRFDTLESEMEIFVLQGSGAIRDAQVNAKYVVSGIKRVPERFCAMHVQYSYDSNHMIHIQARQDESTVDLPIRKEPFTQEDIDVFLRPYQPPEPKVVKTAMTIVMALDVSGSMSGRPLQLAKDAMIDFTSKFPDVEVSFGVLAVSDRCRWVVEPTRNLRSVRSGIDSITCGMTGYGNDANPFPDILKKLRHCDETRYAIVLADGMWSNQSLAVTEAHDCHKAGIDVIGMGFGSADKKFMKDISSVDSVMTTDTQLGASFGKIAQSISGGGMAFSSTSGKKGILGLFGRKETIREIEPRSWETPADMD